MSSTLSVIVRKIGYNRILLPAVHSFANFAVIYQLLVSFYYDAPLAQLDRASGYEPEGREFESLRAHHSSFREVP
jgi:hypothetical protein